MGYVFDVNRVALGLALLAAFALIVGFRVTRDPVRAQVAPTLRLVHRVPLNVRGEHFRAGERVRVRAMLHRSTVATANGRGSFVVSLGTANTRCDLVRVIAV